MGKSRPFFAAAAEAMHRILINRARDRKRYKRGGDRKRLDLDQIELALETGDKQLLALDEALAELLDRLGLGSFRLRP